MANKVRKGVAGRNKAGRLNYFFLEGKLHKSLKISRPLDRIETWCYPSHKRIIYTYSDVLRRHKPAFTTTEVSKMIGRHKDRIEVAIDTGGIEQPQYTYGLTEKMCKHQYMWQDTDIMDLHDYFLQVHRGRPRADGKVTPGDMPSKAELRAMINGDEVLYRVNEDGQFVPVWRANI